MGCSKSSSYRKIHSNTGLPQKTRKISNKQPNLPPKRIRKRKTKVKVNKRKEIIKIRQEMNKIEIKKIENINKSKRWFFERLNKINKPLTRLTRKKRGRTQMKKQEMKEEK